MSTRPEGEFKPAPIWQSALRHPLITGVIATAIVAGAVLGAIYLSQDWTLVRRLAAGGVAGGGCGLLLTAYRIIG
jgi:hypothetical protein